jgi:hypothetical protein
MRYCYYSRALADAEGLLGVYRELMRRATAQHSATDIRAATWPAMAVTPYDSVNSWCVPAIPALERHYDHHHQQQQMQQQVVSDAPLGNDLKLSPDLLVYLGSIAPKCLGMKRPLHACRSVRHGCGY